LRTLVGWLLLIALCGLAGYLQSRWTDSVRAERERLETPTGLHEREESWGRFLIGHPSGAEPVELPELEAPQPEVQFPATEPVPTEGPALQEHAPLTVFEYVVPEGRVLSKICEDFYDSGRSPIPERVAEYNGMRSPDALRAGQTLLLPPWEVLFPDREQP